MNHVKNCHVGKRRQCGSFLCHPGSRRCVVNAPIKKQKKSGISMRRLVKYEFIQQRAVESEEIK